MMKKMYKIHIDFVVIKYINIETMVHIIQFFQLYYHINQILWSFVDVCVFVCDGQISYCIWSNFFYPTHFSFIFFIEI